MKRLCLYLFLFILTAAVGMTRPAMAGGELDEIYRLTDEKKLDQAMKKLDLYLKEHPRDAEARFLLGLILTGKSQSDEAIRVFRELGSDFPDLPEPYNNLAVLYAERGDYDNARQALLNAVRILPDYATAHENLGDVYAKLASQSYAQALRVNSSNHFVSAKQETLKKLFTAAPGRDATAEPKATTKAAAKAAAPVAEAAPVQSVPNVADTAIRSEVDPAAASRGAVTESRNDAEPEAATAAAATTPGGAEGEVERTVLAWAKAWSHRKVDEYLSFYSERSYVPEKFADQEAWRQQRRLAIGAAGTIKITLTGIKVTMTDDSHVQVTFNQNYWSRRYQDQVSKTLTMQKEGSAWKIVREF